MADYSNPTADEEMYADAAPAERNREEDTTEPEEGSDQSETALLPKSILAGKEFNPGDEVVLRIEAIHDDSVEVSYAYNEGEEKGEEPAGERQMGPPEADEYADMMG